MGRWRGLASETLRCLGARCSASVGSSSMFRARVRCLTAVFLASSLGSDIGEEMPSLARDGDRVEQEGAGGIEALEGASAGFCTLGTYLVCTVLLQSSERWRMRRKMWLVGLLVLHLFHHPSTTPRLSPWTSTWSPSLASANTQMVSSSNPMASAHWMSLPWDFQPGANRHARHSEPTVLCELGCLRLASYRVQPVQFDLVLLQLDIPRVHLAQVFTGPRVLQLLGCPV